MNFVNNQLLIGTHHKSGTSWMLQIFKEISKKYNLTFSKVGQDKYSQTTNIVFSSHSIFDFDQISSYHRGIHIIRDPRDMIISGCFYHEKATEQWLHVRKDSFAGMTYQEKLTCLGSIQDKLKFEMEHWAIKTFNRMYHWNYNRSSFYEIKYENLINDKSLKYFESIFRHLGFHKDIMEELKEISYDKSIFSGKLKKTLHHRSGQSNQWKQYFNRELSQHFISLFGNLLIKLGYEKNNDWASMEQ